MPWVQATTLTSRGITLRPLSLDDEAGLIAAATDGELWRLRVTSVPEPENTRQYIDTALQAWRDGHRLAELVYLDHVGHELRLTANVDQPAHGGQDDQQRQNADNLPGLARRDDRANVFIPGAACRQVRVFDLAPASATFHHRIRCAPGISRLCGLLENQALDRVCKAHAATP